jgi:hypothetical protein
MGTNRGYYILVTKLVMLTALGFGLPTGLYVAGFLTVGFSCLTDCLGLGSEIGACQRRRRHRINGN